MARDPSKTESATPKKRRDERKKGNVFLSKDAVAVATLAATIAGLLMVSNTIVEEMSSFMSYCLSLTLEPDFTKIGLPLFVQAIMVVVRVAGPVLGITILASAVATFAQTRFLITAEPLKPKLEKINPLKGFKRLFSLKSLIEAIKGLIKITILLYFVYSCLADLVLTAPNYLYAEITGTCQHLFDSIFSMLLKIAAAFLVVAAADFLYQKWDYEQQLKMTKQEVKEEFKQMEGDPKVKGKIKEIQRKMAMSRMMQQVPESDVIVRNPTHVAVALRYHPGQDEAPIVLAMGLDELALRIISVAEEHNITVIENVPLAHALYDRAQMNQTIPPDLYEAVAEVMIYLYKLGKLKGEPPPG